MINQIHNKIAAGTALSDSTVKTALQTVVIAAGTLHKGKRLNIKGKVRATATNSTDTLAVGVELGSVVLGIAAALDVANNDSCYIDIELVVRDVSWNGVTGTATIVASGFVSALGAEAVATARIAHEISTSVDMTADQNLYVYGTWSVASASNSCICEHLSVTEIV